MPLDDRTADLVRWSLAGEHDSVAAAVATLDEHDRGAVLCEVVSLAGAAIVALASFAGIEPAAVLSTVTGRDADVIQFRRR